VAKVHLHYADRLCHDRPVALPVSPPAPGQPAARRAPRVLLVGAYERDNFGDLLFLLVTER
jgi:hypothetical protein